MSRTVRIDVTILKAAAAPPPRGARELPSVLPVMERPDGRDENGSAASDRENDADIRGECHGGHVTERGPSAICPGGLSLTGAIPEAARARKDPAASREEPPTRQVQAASREED